MKNKFKNLFSNRKTLYFVFCIVLVFIFTLTIVYAALNTVLKITGNAEVVASSWDIYLDNIQIVSGSVSSNEPTIIDKTTASFTTTLTNPGDFYMFTVDVVNNGSIDAMIDSVVKMPTLSESQVKYLNYIVEYQNGESISTKQLVEAGSFVKLKVKVEFRKDLVASDLPTTTETLNLSFTVNYVQSDDSNNNVSIDNNGKLFKVVTGDYDTVGSEICIGKECFYVISSDEDSVTMLAKYNLHVGYKYDKTNGAVELENPTGKQDEMAKGWFEGASENNPLIGVVPFSNENYWSSSVSEYPEYVYNENTYIYEYVDNYKIYLEKLGVVIDDARLISYDELEELGCSKTNSNCYSAPSWVYTTTYWSGDAQSSSNLWIVGSHSGFGNNDHRTVSIQGVRPVITVLKTNFNI